MASATNWLERQIGNHILRSATMPKAAAAWLALFTTKPGEDGTGGTEVSISGTGYGRVLCGPDDSKWSEPSGDAGEFVNLVDFLYNAPTADWGNVIAWGIYDAETGGDPSLFVNLVVAQNILNGALPPKFAAGDLHVTIG